MQCNEANDVTRALEGEKMEGWPKHSYLHHIHTYKGICRWGNFYYYLYAECFGDNCSVYTDRQFCSRIITITCYLSSYMH